MKLLNLIKKGNQNDLIFHIIPFLCSVPFAIHSVILGTHYPVREKENVPGYDTPCTKIYIFSYIVQKRYAQSPYFASFFSSQFALP